MGKSDKWPTHSDGRNKKIGEMTPEESRAVFKAAGGRLQKEFEQPLVQEKLAHILSGQELN